jgi:hypothetical protein
MNAMTSWFTGFSLDYSIPFYLSLGIKYAE